VSFITRDLASWWWEVAWQRRPSCAPCCRRTATWRLCMTS